jgi:hypothetical protein
MYRRVLSLLLVPCALLTQSVALVHAHYGQATGHDPRPHVHVRSTVEREHCHGGHHHHHGHHHGPGGHHHPHDDSDTCLDSLPALPPGQPVDHDSDAAYLTVTDLVSGRLAGFDGVTADCVGFHYPSLIVAVPGVSQGRPAWVHPPPIVPACPLYVRHLALLI